VELRDLPSVDELAGDERLAGAAPRPLLVSAARSALSRAREEIQAGADPGDLRERVELELAAARGARLRRAINATGVIVHTNLGRAPLAREALERVSSVAGGYSNLEYDLTEGGRGSRQDHVAPILRRLTGAEAALVVNNNAAAVLLALAALAEGREVLVSRGELIEIGDGFRIPDVLARSGARLREVGTTNRTRARDYAEAVTRKCAAILRVHRSNFEIVGFTESPAVGELVEVARAKKLPLLYDEGSGRVVDLAPYGFARAETIRELIAMGVDAVTCSTDKLIGATQGGLILGRADIVARCRRHPLLRALRAGKESYAIVGETLRAFAIGKHESFIPIYRMLAAPLEALRARAAEMTLGTAAIAIDSDCALGGGTTPAETIPSIAIEVPGNANELYAAFLRQGIVGRIVDDRFTIEVRTLLDEDVPQVSAALR